MSAAGQVVINDTCANMARRRTIAKRPDELQEFKRQINLTQYAATRGYLLDRRASSRNSAVLVHPAGDKIIVAKGEDGTWIYFSVRDNADNGTIIDFVQRREGGISIGDVRKLLRPWCGGAMPAEVVGPAAGTFVADLVHIPKNLVAVQIEYAKMMPIDGHHAYLENERKIPWHILTDPLFADRIRIDHHENAVFPHQNTDGLCGYELKNYNFTGFAPQGSKGLWFSQFRPDDRRLVIAEKGIDALSYAALKFHPATRYVSTAGTLSPNQYELLKRAIVRMPQGSQVIMALDHDAGGDKIGSNIEAIFKMANRPDLILSNDRPPIIETDWNDVLRTTAETPNTRQGLALRP